MASSYFPISTPAQFSDDDVTVFSNDIQSTSKDTGAIVVEGGVGVEKNIHVGGYTSLGGGYLYRTTTSTAAMPEEGVDPETAIIFDISNRIDANLYSVSNTGGTNGGTRITFLVAGDYKISYSVGIIKTGGTRTTVRAGLYNNAGVTFIVGSESSCYLRNNSSNTGNAVADVIYTATSAGAASTLELQAYQVTAQNCSLDPNSTRLLIERI